MVAPCRSRARFNTEISAFFGVSQLQKIKKHPCRPAPGEKMPFYEKKTIKILLGKISGSPLLTSGIGSRFTDHMIISGRLKSNLKTSQK